MTCRDTRRLIASYVDEALGGAQRLQVESHLNVCHDCRREDADLRELGQILRGAVAAVPLPVDGLRGLAGGVISRIGAEAQQSWRAKLDRVFEDWHWVAVGSGAFGAGFVTAFLVLVLLVAPVMEARQVSQRTGTLYVMALPEDGQGAPVMLEFERSMGTASGDPRYAVPASFGWKAEQALVAELDRSLMRHGRLVRLVDLSPADRDEVIRLLAEISRLRAKAPTRRPGGLTNVSGMHLVLNEYVTASGL